jgi:predicted transcriptional regulator
MHDYGFIDEAECIKRNTQTLYPIKDWGQQLTCKDLDLKETPSLKGSCSAEEAIALMDGSHIAQFPVTNDAGEVLGMMTSQHLMERLFKKKLTMKDSIEKFVITAFKNVSMTCPLSEVSRILALR